MITDSEIRYEFPQPAEIIPGERFFSMFSVRYMHSKMPIRAGFWI
jgi:hypothetical protein